MKKRVHRNDKKVSWGALFSTTEIQFNSVQFVEKLSQCDKYWLNLVQICTGKINLNLIE